MKTQTTNIFEKVCKNFSPPEDITVSEWADKYRRLSPESSAEAGPWRTSRTPYLKEPMDAFTDPKVRNIVMVSASQIGKSEFELNCIAYAVDQDPATIIYVQPNLDDAAKFSDLRINPMIRDCKPLKKKIKPTKGGRDNSNTKLIKSFPGGRLFITGSNSPSALASTPARYIIGDERDRWAPSAGREGDPWELAKARQATFFNSKSVEVSTPTIKGASNIETSYLQGTQERWCTQCPECGEYSEITFNSIRYQETHTKVNGKNQYKITSGPDWLCPHCGCLIPEDTARRQKQKWVANNPTAYNKGIRSFWLNAFCSPWTPWAKIIMKFLESKDDPERLKVVCNTLFGELWEDRSDIGDESEYLKRREEYDAEIPDGVLVLTMGVDTQDDRLEYEVVGHGKFGETWGIQRGIIMGIPSKDNKQVWSTLEGLMDKTWHYKNGKGRRISLTFIDSQGHHTEDVYEICYKWKYKNIFAIQGRGGSGYPYVTRPNRYDITLRGTWGKSKKSKRKSVKPKYINLYNLGVDAGKELIMSSLLVQSPGTKYCHFPSNPDRGYNEEYFNGLLSEKKVYERKNGVSKWVWKPIVGHKRNEPLDCRNYAMAAFRTISGNLNMDQIEQEIKQDVVKKAPEKPRRKKASFDFYGGGNFGDDFKF